MTPPPLVPVGRSLPGSELTPNAWLPAHFLDKSRARRLQPEAPTARAVSHPDNRAERRGPGSVDSVVVVAGSSGFDWGDALIGSLGGVGAALLLMGGVLLLAGQRSKTRLA